jgi:hypothetical protein
MNKDGSRRPLTRVELIAGVAGASAVFAIIILTSVGRNLPFVRTFIVGPYGLMSAFWLGLILGIPYYFMTRQNRRKK